MHPHNLDQRDKPSGPTGYVRAPLEPSARDFLVPPIAANHRDPVVRELVKRLVRLYDCRASLRVPLSDARGDLLLPPFPELLQRPQTRAREDGPSATSPEFERRRSDGMESILRTLLTVAACTDWVSMEILDPRGGYLSVPRLAELAGLPVSVIAPKEEGDRVRKRHDRTDRALRALRLAHIIAFTQQHREQLEDGSYTSTSPALRKLAVGLFRKFGGYVLRLFEKRRKRLKQRREREAPTTGDLRVAATVRELGRDIAGEATGSHRSDAPVLLRGGTVPADLLEQIHDEHPDWLMGEIFVEARRRLERGPPRPPPSPPDDETN